MSILLILMALFALVLLRNEATYRARMAILMTSTPEDRFAGNTLHDLLPSYDQMMLHPAFWLKWTEADWREYITKATEGPAP